MKTGVLTTLAASVAMYVAAQAPAAVLVVDDFEGYTDGQQLSFGSGSANQPSEPWLRFGNAVGGHITATNQANAITGAHSGNVPLTWTSATNATYRYNFGENTDLSEYTTASVTVRSSNAVTLAGAQLSFSDNISSATGETTWVTTTPVSLAGATAHTLTFDLDEAAMTRSGGANSFDAALASVRSIGLRFSNTSGQTGETIVIDSFELNSPIPEPTSGLVLVVGAAATLMHRRRVHA